MMYFCIHLTLVIDFKVMSGQVIPISQISSIQILAIIGMKCIHTCITRSNLMDYGLTWMNLQIFVKVNVIPHNQEKIIQKKKIALINKQSTPIFLDSCP